jgi:glycosyltransferase involved in cell wall biosynthesis
MRILWIVNITFPEALELLGVEVKSYAGGWMLSSASDLIHNQENQLAVASICRHVDKLTRFHGNGITYYLLPYGKGNLTYNPKYEDFWRQIEQEFAPDIVHIHGTEFTHGLSFVNACGNSKVVVSIQGLLSVIQRYSYCGISVADIFKSLTFRDLISKSSLFYEKKEFRSRGQFEIELIQKVNHVIGRTSWDKAHVFAMNDKAAYYHCNESLRNAFYQGRWSYDSCAPFSIFLSQGSAALKGAHQVFKAMPLVLKYYPNTQIRIAGANPIVNRHQFGGTQVLTGYANYLRKLIKRLGIENHITYLGSLSEEQMKQEYLNANVFICPSSIENSPNSLCEAQMLGVPCISAFVGGAPDMIPNSDCGILYRFDDIEMLAMAIIHQFNASKYFDNSYEISLAKDRHSHSNNRSQLLSIYSRIVNKS